MEKSLSESTEEWPERLESWYGTVGEEYYGWSEEESDLSDSYPGLTEEAISSTEDTQLGGRVAACTASADSVWMRAQ